MNKFFAGVVATLGVQALIAAGFMLGIPTPVTAPVEAALVRQMTFKVLAPKGYEDVGYVQFNCTPNEKAILAANQIAKR